MGIRDEVAALKRERIITAAVELFYERGYENTTLDAVAERLGTYAFVDDVRYGEEWVEKLFRLRSIAGIAGLILGGTFAAVAMIIIGATIRMTVLARAKEIEIMRLVGATDAFIRRPFLLEGLMKGILGGLVALILTWLAHRAIAQWVVATAFFDLPLMLLGITAGAALGVVGSALSVGRQLRDRA